MRQWEGVSRDGGPLEKHRSQVDAVLELLGAGVADARARLADGRGHEVPGQVLDLFHVWDFYRGRFMLRRVRHYRRTLDVADELAWECYRPVLEREGARPKEPPLAGFSRSASPRAHRRGSAYHDLLPRGGIHTREGRQAAARLPFPVIEVPWHFCAHLPAVLTVAHETAHHIEDDCGLTDELRQRITDVGLPPDRAAHWRRWVGEAFADVCAAVVCGPAYGEVLAELLRPEGPHDDLHDDPYDDPDSPHPPAATRLMLAGAAARAAGHPDPGSLPDPDEETGRIVVALLETGYRGLDGRRPAELLTPADADRVPAGARRLLDGGTSGCDSAATVLAAAARAFQTDPAAYDRRGVEERALTEVLRLRPAGSRGIRAPDPATEAAHSREHAAAGALLLTALAATDPGRQPPQPKSP